MTADILALYGLGATVAFAHTILGPDHYLPFIALSRSGRWSLGKTVAITVLCGIAHVLGSVVLGLLGIACGTKLLNLQGIESIRGALAGWLLLGFGLAYTVWGIRMAIRERSPFQAPAIPSADSSLTPWILFAIFVFGPCEPLIPLLMLPAAQASWSGVASVAMVFGLVTVCTMTAVVVAAVQGTPRCGDQWLGRCTRRYGHAMAGLVVLVCGALVKAGV